MDLCLYLIQKMPIKEFYVECEKIKKVGYDIQCIVCQPLLLKSLQVENESKTDL